MDSQLGHGGSGTDSLLKKIRWYDNEYPALHNAKRENAERGHRERTIFIRTSRKDRNDERSKIKSRSLSRGRDYLPHYRSKSACELDEESVVAQFRPVVNHKEVINHTYTCHEGKERSRSRSLSRHGFTRKVVETVPASQREDHREKTILENKFRDTKNIYSEPNTTNVEKHFFKRLAEVKKEEYRSVSKSKNKDSKQKRKTLLQQIQDLKKINSKYGRATEKLFNSKFSTYHPTDTISRSRNTNAIQNKMINSHNFSKWRHMQTGNDASETKTIKTMKSINKRAYKGPSWEKEGLSYMKRLEQQEQKEDSTSGDSGTMRDILKEAENMLNVVNNFPEAMGEGPVAESSVSAKHQSTLSKIQPSKRSNKADAPPAMNDENQSMNHIYKAGSDRLISHLDTGKVQYSNRLSRYKTSDNIGISKRSDDLNYPTDRPRRNRSDRSPFNFERSQSLNTVHFHGRKNKESKHRSLTSDLNAVPKTRLSKLPTDLDIERNYSKSALRNIRRHKTGMGDEYEETDTSNKRITNKYKHLSDLSNRPIVIPAPALPQYSESDKTSKTIHSDEKKQLVKPASNDEQDSLLTGNALANGKQMKESDIEMIPGDGKPPTSKRSSPIQLKSRNGEKRPVMSGYLIRIEKVEAELNDGGADIFDKNRKTPILSLSRRSVRRSPSSKPGSRDKVTKSRNSFGERILITPVSVKNKKFLVANCRIVTPVLPTIDKTETDRDKSKNRESNFFLTAFDIEDANSNRQNQATIKDAQINTNVICLEKWKALVQDYLKESETPAGSK